MATIEETIFSDYKSPKSSCDDGKSARLEELYGVE